MIRVSFELRGLFNNNKHTIIKLDFLKMYAKTLSSVNLDTNILKIDAFLLWPFILCNNPLDEI